MTGVSGDFRDIRRGQLLGEGFSDSPTLSH